MHKEELKDVVKELFGNFTEGQYLSYFTSRFPRLLAHCYNAVEKEARGLMAEYFHEDASAQAPTADIGTHGLELEGSELTINCEDDITILEEKVEIHTLKIWNISHLFVEQNKSFTNFLQNNGPNVIQLEFDKGSLKFDSMNKILQKLPNLKEIEFDNVKYEASKTNQTIQQTTCKNLVELKILWAENSNLLKAFQECRTIRKLTVNNPEVTLEEILQKCASLEELEVEVDDNYPVNNQNKANATIHQLKVLNIKLCTKDEKIQVKLISSILKQNNLQQFYIDSDDTFSLSRSLCQDLAAHIWQLKRLSSLKIFDKKLLEEVEAFAAICRVNWNTRLEEFRCELKHFKSLQLPSLVRFTNLKKLDIDCEDAEQTKVEDLISFMHQSQLTSIRLEWFPPASCQLLKQLLVHSLQHFVIHIDNMYQVKVCAFDILQEFLPRHQNITQLEILFANVHDEPKLLEIIPMILATLPHLEVLQVSGCPEFTPEVIKQIAELKTLRSWWINDHKSKT